MADSSKWQVQLGPDIVGSGVGAINSARAMLYVSAGTGDVTTYVSYSTTGQHEWVPVPNNTPVEVSGDNTIDYRWAVAPGAQIKFVITIL